MKYCFKYAWWKCSKSSISGKIAGHFCVIHLCLGISRQPYNMGGLLYDVVPSLAQSTNNVFLPGEDYGITCRLGNSVSYTSCFEVLLSSVFRSVHWQMACYLAGGWLSTEPRETILTNSTAHFDSRIMQVNWLATYHTHHYMHTEALKIGALG